WEQERTAVFDAICALRQLCEALSDHLADLRWRQLGASFDNPNVAYRALNQWAHEERAQIEAAGRSRDDEGKEEPFEIPPLHALRQTYCVAMHLWAVAVTWPRYDTARYSPVIRSPRRQ